MKKKSLSDCFINVLFSIILFLFIYVLFGFSMNGSDGLQLGTLSDVVIALSNLAMALTAIFAAYKAKGWFENIKHENASLAVIKLIQDCIRINSILNAISSNVNERLENRLSVKPNSLLNAYGEFKQSKFALKVWGSDRFDVEFIKKIEKIKTQTYFIYNQINSIQKRKDVIAKQTIQGEIKTINDIINDLESKEIDDILTKKQ